jgi:endonuclease/exonuclease/phosphatase family metal-dependent hydrolase
MRLATYNILHGMALPDGTVDADRLGAAVADLDADVLGLQEVDRGQPRSANVDQTAVAAAALDATQWRFAPTVTGTPGEDWRPVADGDTVPAGTRAYGIGLVSRYPVRRWHVLRMRPMPGRAPLLIPPVNGRGPRVILLPDEPRAVLAAEVDSPHGPVTVATAHLSFSPGWNVWQLRHAVRALRALPGPRILLGDFNLPGALPRWSTGWRELATAVGPTYPSFGPRLQIDHVIADGDLPPVKSARTVTNAVSDHLAVVVDLG